MGASVGEDSLHPVAALEALDLGVGHHVHAIGDVQPEHPIRHLLTQGRFQRVAATFDHGDLLVTGNQGGRNLTADEPGAHHHDLSRRCQSVASGDCAGKVVDLTDAGQLRARKVEAPR